MSVNGGRLGHDMEQGDFCVKSGGQRACKPNRIVDKMFAAAEKENAREPLAGSDRHEDRWLNCFNDFVGAAGCLSPPGAVTKKAVFFVGVFAEICAVRLPVSVGVFELAPG